MLDREAVRAVACPQCHAAPGEPCAGKRRPREANHRGRQVYAERARLTAPARQLEAARTAAAATPAGARARAFAQLAASTPELAGIAAQLGRLEQPTTGAPND